LTTIKHPKEQMGIDAANMILKLIESPLTKKVESIVYEPELVIRESTKEVKN
jgi:GntR family transcriptional regulator of arabinose operon